MTLLNGSAAENNVSRPQTMDNQAADFWQRQFVGLDIGRFPHTSTSTHRAPEWPMKTHECLLDDASFTSQTDIISIFRAAWSVLLSRHSNSPDTVFGICNGGTASPVPIRIQVDEGFTVAELLHRVKSHAAELLPHEVPSLSQIQGLTDEARRACQFQTLLIEGGADEELLSRISTANDGIPNTCSLILSWARQDTDQVHLSWHADPAVLNSEEVKRLTHQLQLLLQQLTQPDLANTKLSHLQQASSHDLSTIWKWNAHVPEAVQDNVHRIFAERVWDNPSAPAVCAWDGELSYSELDKASAALARHLSALGVRPGTIVPLCLTKSVYVPVAILAVMKAGGASVLLDVTLPAARLRAIVEQLPSSSSSSNNNHLILCSSGHEPLAASACPPNTTCITVNDSSLTDLRRLLAEGPLTPSSPALPDSPLYVVFTSGSTGKPKGATITHANFCAAVRHHQGADALGFSSSSRVLDLVSYAFDVAWSNILHTLTAGGCLCIPSEEQRSTGGGIARAVAALRANVLHVTPTVARVLDPGRVEGLEKIMFIGEPLSWADAARWEGGGRQVLNTYGPAECTVTSTFCVVDSSSSSMRDPSIGRAIGAVAWVVHPDGQRLAALGTVGELWLEGPIVGAGYMGEPEKTAAVFVDSPPWLTAGLPEHGVEGRRGRLYRTGDMVRYNADGTISFAGRRDNQVKIRGQRIELGEVEHHAREMLPADRVPQVVAEVIKLNNAEGLERADANCLVLFFTLAAEGLVTDLLPLEHRAAPLVAALRKHLAVNLPSAMVPSAFIPLAALPMTASGKTDRKKLRELGALLKPDLLLGRAGGSGAGSEEASEKEPLTTETENKLSSLWKAVLRLKPDAVVGAGDSFLRHGGDSVLAMQLADTAHDAGLSLSVQDILRNPCLRDMARVAESGGPRNDQDATPVPPFSLLQPGTNEDDVHSQTAALCGVTDPAMVEDVFPCTPLQEGLLAMTALTPDQYVARNLVELHPDVDASRFEQALRRVIVATPILRTRIVDLPGQGLTQVVLRHASQEPCTIIVRQNSGSTDNLWRDEVKDALDMPMGLGTDLARFAVVVNDKAQRTHLAWTMHHAVYDAWSLELLQEALERAYHGAAAEPAPGLQPLVRYVLGVNKEEQRDFWKRQFRGLQAQQFPALATATYQPRADGVTEHSVDHLEWPSSSGITPSSIIRAAWAVVLSRRCASPDALFGAVVLGRQAPVPGISRLAGPTIATVPLRVAVDSESTVANLLEQVQNQSIDMIPHEQTGLQAIRRVGEEADRACQLLQSLLVVQPAPAAESNPSPIFQTPLDDERDSSQPTAGIDLFSTHALTLTCHLTPTSDLRLKLLFDSSVLTTAEAASIAHSLDHTLHQLCQPSLLTHKIRDLPLVPATDLERIWSWNAHLPPTAVHACVHDLIADRVREDPDAPAIAAWDGELTYGRLDELSTLLARELVARGVRRGDIVPLCFEKSVWVPVAKLAVMKAGAASVTMDSSQPEERLRSIVLQAGSEDTVLVLSGEATEGVALRLMGGRKGRVFVLTGSTFASMARDEESMSEVTLPVVQPEDLLYLVFTSGSTGVPKGVMITHQNFATATTHHTAALGFKRSSRVADFASYAFDVSWANFINTLTAGGCLCIPSEHDRKHDMAGFMARFNVNYADLTPSVAALLDPDAVPSLETVVVGGELVELDKLRPLRERVKSLLITYGPAECTVTASAVDVCKHDAVPARSIGWPCGAATWIVDPDNCDALVPIGAIGELVLEGPLNGLGYLNNAEKTAAAFVENPKWLTEGTDKVPGRRGRLYKTGDLVKYHPEDGSLIFIGRKDDQVKIRGQRVDLSEIEFNIRSLLPSEPALHLVAEVITPRGSHSPVLVVFFSHRQSDSFVDDTTTTTTPTASSATPLQTLQAQLTPLLPNLDRALASRLPVFMLPSAYVPLATGIPISATGKTDRRAVRAHGASLDLPSLLALSRSIRSDSDSGGEGAARAQPETETEKELQRLWAGVLGLEEGEIGVRDSFMRLGGDSIAAMRLAAAARGSKLVKGLTVAQVMKYPRLGELAGVLEGELKKRVEGEGGHLPSSSSSSSLSSLSSAATAVGSFSLLLKPALDIDQLRQAAAEQCSVDAVEVEDVYPCTALQEGLMALTAKKPGSYIQRTLLELQPHVDVDRLRRAWEDVVAAAPILRTRIVDLGVDLGGLAQVVLRSNQPLAWKRTETVESHRMSEREEEREQRSMCLGAPLVTFGLVEDSESQSSGPRYLACTQHHATYDGWSLKLLFEAVEEAYTKQQAVPRESLVPFQPFIQYLTAVQSAETQSAFWTSQFSGLDASPFPVVPSQYQPQLDRAFDHTIDNLCWPTDDVTPSSVLRAAWATLLSWYTATPDAVFGAVVSGRQAAVPDMDKLAGPTIATVPVRILVEEDMSVAELLRRTGLQAADMIPFEQAGLQNIARCSDEARRACEFQTLLVVQAAETSDRDTAGRLAGHDHTLFKRVVEDEESQLAELGNFGTYALTVTCDVDGPAMRVRLGFDSKVITSVEVSRLAHQLEHILRQFCQPDAAAASGLKVGQLSATPAHDLATIWGWNKTVPETVISRVHDLFQQRVRENPAAPAVCAHDGELTFRELDDLSTRLARHLHHKAGVQAGVIVPLYFEKSVWVPVAILGVMKAGGACVTMDATLPVERLRNIVEQVAPVLLLNSAACEAAALEVTDVPKLTINHAFLSQLEVTNQDLPTVDPNSPLYLVFTSGSTGKPKGAVVTHANYCSSARHHQAPLGIERTSRIYEFTSYAFDVAWSNMLHAFTSGACLCIPSEQDRITDIAGSVRRLAADLMHITPTVANILDPQSLPTLKKMLFTGEALKRGDVARWRSRPDVLYYNTYGPAECTVTSSVAVVDAFGEQEPTIGQPYGVLAWIVQPDGKSLAAVGAPGELWVEGPTVGAGYLNNPDKTAAAFVEDPEWLLRGSGAGVPGRRGRLYRTGDIVRYNPDGSLFYFGRKDTQVKIRGQRVELGEVDYNVRQLLPPSVQQVVAEIITPDVTKAPMLAVFFTTAEKGDEIDAMVDALKQQLVQRVPPYMVPAAYIPLAELPMTASGKTDRRALRELGKAYSALGVSKLEDDANVSACGEEQLTEEEKTLRTIWASLLNVDARSIGPDHSFSRLGGDSIKTMSLAVALRKQWNLQVPISRLLAGSSSHGDTLRGMAALVCSLQQHGQKERALTPTASVDLESELAALTAQMRLPPQMEHRPTVFLTGATGYLGTQILRHIITGGVFGHAVLLVRRSGTQDGFSRVLQAAVKAGWWQDSFASFISVWDGDLAAPRLGLTGKQWASLCGSRSYGLADDLPAIDAVIHNGAAVHWGAHYEHLKAANVGSTLQLLQATLHSTTLKKFVYVSGGLSARDWADATTTTTSATGYDQSKYISERLVLAAATAAAEDEMTHEKNKKNRFSVVKPGLIIGDAHDGIANPDDFLWRVVAAASRLRARPVESPTARLDVQDVAFVASVVLQHAIESDSDSAAHGHRPDYVELNRGMPVEAFWDAVQDALEKPELRPVTWDEWIEMARRDIAEVGEQHPLFPVQHFLGNLGAEEDDERASLVGVDGQSVEREREIREVGEAVRMNVRYLRKAGVLGGEEEGISWREATANLTMRSRKW